MNILNSTGKLHHSPEINPLSEVAKGNANSKPSPTSVVNNLFNLPPESFHSPIKHSASRYVGKSSHLPPTPEQVGILDRAMDDLPITKKATPVTKQVFGRASIIIQEKSKQTGKSPGKISEEYYQRVYEKAQENGSLDGAVSRLQASSWAPTVVGGCLDNIKEEERKRKLPSYLDPHHLMKKSKGGGFHFCPESSEDWQEMEDVAQSVQGGAVSAKWKMPPNGEYKSSSFFAPNLTDRGIRALWRGATPLSDYEPKDCLNSLVRGEMNGDSIVIEKKSSANPMISHSGYPVFRYISDEEINLNSTIQITRESNLGGQKSQAISISAEKARQIGNRILEDKLYGSVRYTNTDRSLVVLDIARDIFDNKIPKGVYLEMPVSREVLQDVREAISTKRITPGQKASLCFSAKTEEGVDSLDMRSLMNPVMEAQSPQKSNLLPSSFATPIGKDSRR